MSLPTKKIFLLGLGLIIIILNMYMYFIPSTSASYSLLSRFDAYHSLYNWNLPTHATGLFDDDNQEDVVEFTGCVFLTRTNNRVIEEDKECEMMSRPLSGKQAFRGTRGMLGLIVIKEVNHSFLAKKAGENWKIHEHVMGIPILHEIMPNGTVTAVTPTLSEWVDAFSYLVTHLFTFVI